LFVDGERTLRPILASSRWFPSIFGFCDVCVWTLLRLLLSVKSLTDLTLLYHVIVRMSSFQLLSVEFDRLTLQLSPRLSNAVISMHATVSLRPANSLDARALLFRGFNGSRAVARSSFDLGFSRRLFVVLLPVFLSCIALSSASYVDRNRTGCARLPVHSTVSH